MRESSTRLQKHGAFVDTSIQPYTEGEKYENIYHK